MNRFRNRASFGNSSHGFGRKKFNKSKNGGSFSYPKRFAPVKRFTGGPKSKLVGEDISIVIKKATQV